MKTAENQQKNLKKKMEKNGLLTSGKCANRRWIDGSTCVPPNINPLRRAFVRLQQLSCETSWRDSDPFFSVFFFLLLSLFHENAQASESFSNLLLLRLDIQIIYTSKSVKCTVNLPEFTKKKKRPKIPPGSTVPNIFSFQKAGEYFPNFYSPYFFFSCRIFPVTGQHFSTSGAATPERLFHQRRVQRWVKLEKLITAERSDLQRQPQHLVPHSTAPLLPHSAQPLNDTPFISDHRSLQWSRFILLCQSARHAAY